jgi:hypothetical protein
MFDEIERERLADVSTDPFSIWQRYVKAFGTPTGARLSTSQTRPFAGEGNDHAIH